MNIPAKQALINYFKGNADPEERRAIELYLAMNLDADYVEECLREAMTGSDIDERIAKPDQQQAWNAFQVKLAQLNKPLPVRHNNWIGYAAAVLLLALTAGVLFFKPSHSQLQPKNAYQRIQAGYGKIKKLTLADGSHLTLFPGAVIDIPANYNVANRKVFLNGKTYFQVAHNKQKPFFVISSSVTTRVLGTTFEVNAPHGDQTASVILQTGRVRVSSGNHRLTDLTPNQQILFQTSTGKFSVQKIQAQQALTWISGELVFDQQSLAEVCLDLQKWYHITIVIHSDELAHKKLTTSIKNQSSAEMLNILAVTAGFSYSVKNSVINIYQKGGTL